MGRVSALLLGCSERGEGEMRRGRVVVCGCGCDEDDERKGPLRWQLYDAVRFLVRLTVTGPLWDEEDIPKPSLRLKVREAGLGEL